MICPNNLFRGYPRRYGIFHETQDDRILQELLVDTMTSTTPHLPQMAPLYAMLLKVETGTENWEWEPFPRIDLFVA